MKMYKNVNSKWITEKTYTKKVNFMFTDNAQVNINCLMLACQYGCDLRTVSKAIERISC